MLCYLYDADGRLLLLHRIRDPNAGMYSPIGGKLDQQTGESPHACAIREIAEEAGVTVTDDEVRLNGVVSERAYEGRSHWLIFLFEITRPIGHDEVAAMHMREGVLEWIPPERIESLEIPDTDREILWPLVREHRGRFFMVDIDCSRETMAWRVQESAP